MKQINFQMYLLAFSVFMDNNRILWKRAESYKHSSRYLTNIDSMHAPTNDSILVENIDKCNYFWICIAYSSIFNDSWKKIVNATFIALRYRCKILISDKLDNRNKNYQSKTHLELKLALTKS